LVTVFVVSTLLISGLLGIVSSQAVSLSCETCSMTVASDAQAHLKVVDENGTRHNVECLKCALKLLKTCSEITITTNCDWNGPNSVITINFKNGVNSTTVNPPTALLIDGGCTKNRVVYDQAAADQLLANNGSSPYLTAIQNTTIPSNATVMTFAQAAAKYGFIATPDPTPTPTPPATVSPTITRSTPQPTAKPTPKPTVSPTNKPTPAPTIITVKDCEACGMEVNADAQARYIIVDGSGQTHYVECFMCALNLLNDYDNLTITTCCDWYGSSYPITVQSQQFGAVVNVTPSTAMFLKGGSCVTNRVAYNQTAADQLLANGFSQYTLSEQCYDLPADTTVALVANYALVSAKNDVNPTATGPVLIAGTAGAAIIALSIVAYKRLRSNGKA
jgi:hypothetical protein